MLNSLKQFIAPPSFPEDQDKTRAAFTLYAMLANTVFLLAITALNNIFFSINKSDTYVLLGLMLLCTIVSFFLMKRGQVRAGAWAWVITIGTLLSVLLLLSGRIETSVTALFVSFTISVTLLLGRNAALLVTAIYLSIGLVMVLAEMQGYVLPRVFPLPPFNNWVIWAISFLITLIPVDVTLKNYARALQRAQKSEKRYMDLFESAPMMYVILREQKNTYIINACNNAFLQTLGYERAQVVGHGLSEFYTPASRQAMLQEGIVRTANDFPHPLIERDLVTRDGRVIHTQVHTSPELDAQGKVLGILGMYVDVTARKQAERALQEEQALLAQRVEKRTAELMLANAELSQAVRAKDDFLATMSHELRTPLTAILGYSEALLEGETGPLTEAQLRAAKHIQSGGRHLLEIINDILDLAKIEANRLELRIDTVPVSDTCRAAMMFVRELANRKRIRLDFQIDDAALTLQADSKRLKQMLVNLLSNAVKFTPDDGKVSLLVERDNAALALRFTVQDTGIGIAPQDLTRLFKPFSQLDSGLARQHEGTGLGLVLVRRLAELHGGSVDVTSQVGIGSRFTLTLPYHPIKNSSAPLAQDQADANVLPFAPQLQGIRILLAEDNDLNIEVLQNHLQAHGSTVFIARNGKQAVEKTNAYKPDIILMDIQMPVLDGLEAIRLLRAQNEFAATPIIALTALAMPGDMERCLQAGATEYMSKPPRLQELTDRIRALAHKD